MVRTLSICEIKPRLYLFASSSGFLSLSINQPGCVTMNNKYFHSRPISALCYSSSMLLWAIGGHLALVIGWMNTFAKKQVKSNGWQVCKEKWHTGRIGLWVKFPFLCLWEAECYIRIHSLSCRMLFLQGSLQTMPDLACKGQHAVTARMEHYWHSVVSDKPP